VLITGGGGRIGVEVVRYFRECGIAVTSLDITKHPDLEAERVVVGDAADESLLSWVLRPIFRLPAVDAVVHLAAIPHRDTAPSLVVYRTNVVSTFNVLIRAGEAGIENVVTASSFAASGLTFNNHEVLPAYYPVDVNVPADIADWYSLSKASDELTARMISRRYGTSITALRLPFCNSTEQVEWWSQYSTDDPTNGVCDGWSYLHARDAGRAALASLQAGLVGFNAFHIAARDTCVPYLTEELLDRYAPGVPRRRALEGREVAVDLTDAKQRIGFEAEFVLDLEPRPLPQEVAAR
jgi:nucleoside-diphosphate-sugar epimerase